MALHPCPSCGHPISDRAVACPNCGTRFDENDATAPPANDGDANNLPTTPSSESDPAPAGRPAPPPTTTQTQSGCRNGCRGCFTSGLAILTVVILIGLLLPGTPEGNEGGITYETPAPISTPEANGEGNGERRSIRASDGATIEPPDTPSEPAPDTTPETSPPSAAASGTVVPVDVTRWPAGTPRRRAAEFFAAYARQDWNAMTDIRLPSQDDREMAFNWLEGSYFFREYRELESISVRSRNDVSARVRVTWRHDLGRSYVDLMIIRENAAGNPTPNAPWSVSYTSAVGVRDLD